MTSKTIIKHEMERGTLTVALILEDAEADRQMMELVFDHKTNGVVYEAAFTHNELCCICPVFHMQEEIPEIMAEMPVMVYGPGPKAPLSAQFKYVGKKREYLIPLPLRVRECPDVKDVELKSQVVALEAKVAALESHVSKIASTLFDYFSGRPGYGSIAARMVTMRSPGTRVEYDGSRGEDDGLISALLEVTSADNLVYCGEHAPFNMPDTLGSNRVVYRDAVIILDRMADLDVKTLGGRSLLEKIDSVIMSYVTVVFNQDQKRRALLLQRAEKLREFRALVVARM